MHREPSTRHVTKKPAAPATIQQQRRYYQPGVRADQQEFSISDKSEDSAYGYNQLTSQSSWSTSPAVPPFSFNDPVLPRVSSSSEPKQPAVQSASSGQANLTSTPTASTAIQTVSLLSSPSFSGLRPSRAGKHKESLPPSPFSDRQSIVQDSPSSGVTRRLASSSPGLERRPSKSRRTENYLEPLPSSQPEEPSSHPQQKEPSTTNLSITPLMVVYVYPPPEESTLSTSRLMITYSGEPEQPSPPSQALVSSFSGIQGQSSASSQTMPPSSLEHEVYSSVDDLIGSFTPYQQLSPLPLPLPFSNPPPLESQASAVVSLSSSSAPTPTSSSTSSQPPSLVEQDNLNLNLHFTSHGLPEGHN